MNILAHVPIGQVTTGFLVMPVFLDPADFDEHIASGIVLVAQEMVNKSHTWIAVTTGGDTS